MAIFAYKLNMEEVASESAALVQAMLFGKASLLQEETHFLFARLGLSHILSASGFHMMSVVIFANCTIKIILQTLIYLLPNLRSFWSIHERKCIAVSSTFFMALLADACGWQKPMVRAFALGFLWNAAKLLALHPSKEWILAWSLLCAYFWGSGSLLSFSLSALSVLSMFYVMKLYRSSITERKKILLLTIAPFLTTLPLIIYNFHLLAILSPLANLLFCPLLSIFVFFPSFAGIIESLIFSTKYLQIFSEWCMSFILQFMHFFAEILSFSYWVKWNTCIIFFLLLLPILWMKKKRNKNFILYISSLGITFLFYSVFPITQKSLLLNVGQGDAILLTSKNEQAFLVDAGPLAKKPYPSKSSLAIANEAIASLAGILITHPDLDHYGGIDSILTRYKINGAIWLPKKSLFYPKTEFILASAEKRKIPIKFIEEKNFPYKNLECRSTFLGHPTNDLSPLCRFILPSGKKLLLTGDMGSDSESIYLENHRDFLKADILKIAHHGSTSSSSENFLTATQAKKALISAGKRNRYHHPHSEILTRLHNKGIKIQRTDMQGTITID